MSPVYCICYINSNVLRNTFAMEANTVHPYSDHLLVRASADPESFVRGGPNLTGFFKVFLCVSFLQRYLLMHK